MSSSPATVIKLPPKYSSWRFLVAGIIASYWGAFRIYSRMQAVNNQWHNL